MTNVVATTETLTITEILELLPDDARWSIINSELAAVRTCNGRRCRIYWDDHDYENAGWAYHVDGTEDFPDETGKLDATHDIVNVFAV